MEQARYQDEFLQRVVVAAAALVGTILNVNLWDRFANGIRTFVSFPTTRGLGKDAAKRLRVQFLNPPRPDDKDGQKDYDKQRVKVQSDDPRPVLLFHPEIATPFDCLVHAIKGIVHLYLGQAHNKGKMKDVMSMIGLTGNPSEYAPGTLLAEKLEALAALLGEIPGGALNVTVADPAIKSRVWALCVGSAVSLEDGQVLKGGKDKVLEAFAALDLDLNPSFPLSVWEPNVTEDAAERKESPFVLNTARGGFLAEKAA